jgi:hypothetical protein
MDVIPDIVASIAAQFGEHSPFVNSTQGDLQCEFQNALKSRSCRDVH